MTPEGIGGQNPFEGRSNHIKSIKELGELRDTLGAEKQKLEKEMHSPSIDIKRVDEITARLEDIDFALGEIEEQLRAADRMGTLPHEEL